MKQIEADKLIELYNKGYEVYYHEEECEIFKGGEFYCLPDTEEEFIIECDIGDIMVKKNIPDWENL